MRWLASPRSRFLNQEGSHERRARHGRPAGYGSRSATRRTNRCSTRAGKVAFTRSLARCGPGASGTSIPTDTRSRVLPPADYLRMSYYERWLNRLETHVVKYGFVTQEELKSGKAAAGSRTETPVLTLATSARWLSRGIPSSVDPRFDRRSRSASVFALATSIPLAIHDCPRYARGKAGVVTRDHGVYRVPRHQRALSR